MILYLVFPRLGQILNLYWEKTHEAAMYEAVTRALGRLSTAGVRLVDYTASEDVCVPRLPELGFHTKKHYILFLEVEGPGGHEVLLSAQDKAKVTNIHQIKSISCSVLHFKHLHPLWVGAAFSLAPCFTSP